MSSNDQEQVAAMDAPDQLPGDAFRVAREAAGLSISDVAERLKLRIAQVEAIERGDLDALGAPVFARGFVIGYANLLGLPTDLADKMLPREKLVETTPLPAQRKVSHNRHLFDRYARRLVYIALTASIVVPVVLLATRDHLPDPSTLLTPLDLQSDELARTEAVRTPADANRAQDMGPPAPSTDHAVMASFTPFYNQPRNSTPPAPVVEQAVASKGLVLKVNDDSWVEVIDVEGNRLVHELLEAGTEREFDPAKVARVLLGNATVVEVRLNGEPVDMSPYRRANVARFTLSSDGKLEPAGG